MAQSLSRLLIHLVFSTKNRVPALTPEIRTELHGYLAAVLRNHQCPALEVGGVTDHVHILLVLARTKTVAKVAETLKTSSSKWLKTQSGEFGGFFWQAGYGAFSVSQSEAARVIEYIRRQEEHHKKMTFQEEYRQFLARYEVAYDEAHLWD